MKKFESEEEKKEYFRKKKQESRDVKPDVKPQEDVKLFVKPSVKPSEIVITKEMREEMGVKFMSEGGPIILKEVVRAGEMAKLARFVHAKNGRPMKVNGKAVNENQYQEHIRGLGGGV